MTPKYCISGMTAEAAKAKPQDTRKEENHHDAEIQYGKTSHSFR
ncbi:hypothetical protein [Paenibacillus tritici]|nr:hypothetical protein [Paenibacillus tritici]